MSCTFNAALTQTLHEVLVCPICRATGVEMMIASGTKSIRRCTRCDARFLHPQPSLEEVTRYFQTAEEDTPASDLERDYEYCRTEVLGRVAEQIQARKTQGSILDVGCATGFFLNTFFNTWDRFALELSPRKAELAMRGGTQVHLGDLFSARLQPSSFDVATLLDAFYYVRDPHALLGEFRRVLKDDGILVLEMAWAASYIWRRTGVASRLLQEGPLLEASDHLFDYTPRTLSLLLHHSGFILDGVHVLPANRQERWFPDALCRIYSLSSQAVSVFSRGRVCLGPRFMVVARKAPLNRLGIVSSSSR